MLSPVILIKRDDRIKQPLKSAGALQSKKTQNVFCEFWCDYFSHALTGGALEQDPSLLPAHGGTVPGAGCCLWVALLSLPCTEILPRKEGNIPLSP